MKENIVLKYPSGEFTHSILAVFNGKSNQQIWNVYQKAIKDGIIVFVGNKSTGKGKPSKYWKVADGPVPLVDKVEVVKIESKPEPTLVVVTETAIVVEPLPSVSPTVAPVEVHVYQDSGKLADVDIIDNVPVVNTPVERADEATAVRTAPVVRNLTCQVTELKQLCPICKHPMLSVNTATGVTVWCAQPKEICYPNENVYGHGRNINDAYETACDKFKWV
jgi:hypothetical protein